jgi:hypothetical protein
VSEFLPPAPVYLPFQAGAYRPAMGLIAQKLAQLTAFDDQYSDQMAQRRLLLETRRDDVLAVTPGSGAMRAEALSVLVTHLCADRAAWFSQRDDILTNHLTGETWALDRLDCDPLVVAGRLVVEDICLLAPAPCPLLAAAVLCFPSRWRLADKIGQPLGAIHAPVPDYGQALGGPVDRFLGLLKPGRLVARMNWSIHDDAALFQPEANHPPGQAITSSNAGALLTVRIERQTLSRLPQTGAIMFTIRTYQHRLSLVAAVPGAAASLRAALAGLPDSVAAYKGISAFRAALEGYLGGFA